MPRISIVTPAHNAGNFIERTIRAVLGQTFGDWEMIVVDDFSQDNTKQIVQEYTKQDPRIRGIFLDKNSGGPSHPTNVGLAAARGEYVALLDHDDEWAPDKLQKQAALLDAKPDVGLVSCNCSIRDDAGREVGVRDNVAHTDVLHDELSCNFIFGCSSVMFRRKVFETVGGFDENCRVSQDWEFYIRVFQGGFGFAFVPERLFFSHPTAQSQWRGIAYIKRAREVEYILGKHKELFIKDGPALKNRYRRLGGLYVFARRYLKGIGYLLRSI